MGIFTSEKYEIIFESEDELIIGQLVNMLDDSMDKILMFFNLTELTNKTTIVIYHNVEQYKEHCLKYTEYRDWMIADTFDGNINILNFDCCIAKSTNNIITVDDYVKVIIHEFVHICQHEINPNSQNCVWFWEALATNLSGQIMPKVDFSCTKEQLMFDYLNLKNNYAISYNIGEFMLKKYTHQKILDYIEFPQKLIDDTDIIFKQFKKDYCDSFIKKIIRRLLW